jgi:hypothetical protein
MNISYYCIPTSNQQGSPNTYNPVKGVVKFLQLIAVLPERQDNRHCLLGDIEQVLATTELLHYK